MTVLLTSEGVERLARAHGTAQYGGYYAEKRIRELRPELITHVQP
jgi:hypothetical protein